MYIVYVVVNTLNNKCYVGMTCQSLDKRWYDHCNAARNGSSYYFHRALRKYGFEVWERHVWLRCDSHKVANINETQTIVEFESHKPKKGYNRTMGGDGCSATEETRRKISEAHKGKVHSTEARAKMSATHKAKAELGLCILQRSDVRAKTLAARVGIPHTEETRAKMSLTHQGKEISDEARQNMSEAHKGVPLSKEHRQALSKGQNGRIVSEDTRRKLRAKHLGKKMSEEARKKMSEKAKQREAKKRGEI